MRSGSPYLFRKRTGAISAIKLLDPFFNELPLIKRVFVLRRIKSYIHALDCILDRPSSPIPVIVPVYLIKSGKVQFRCMIITRGELLKCFQRQEENRISVKVSTDCFDPRYFVMG